MAPVSWKTNSTREIYKNKWMHLREDIAQLPNGKTTIYGVVTTAHAVAVLPFVDRSHVALVRQYRYVFGESHRWEVPSGGVYAGEAIEDAAQREMMEEVGYRAGQLQHVSTYYPSKSILNETGHLFVGFDLERTSAIPDETEFFEVAVMPFTDVLEMVIASEIRDSMSVITILHAARLLRC
jgi:ADP-ribose pyrophosphatase